ncbi:alkanesulfonate monooxygenase SsuD/methylene tetrahydromethanopterin reductase-like flavin-dependent oxidoreductase (luciferase family) [Nocardioides zeae]|uniref:Alkanesulfonate monooxygenase SsuD/methylene tetrahydromethanopterin reductase-like flavin-dependent oxidoreductase (Luciferase family) n=1 Tax=Nocardioides zeae TaxID=1457234 RepID=A0ACC6ILL7_9ACTN|nr:LLM class flavin-dependent oxidoreductase [Nocardioides zeae]MDR6175031.1 alkanesulfonate monooxygenase SsuD/methylene tetrahydromethanopterin reductase-like flavin-dependent oxidoreductase (luciferase family) [Nocardioides zeae]MDR6211609.1 alkanesulfonate monooxygenase SsuD/methylene tetrahydromethanopterin reductase-like flavin-dependent oxidoreductase (luciferase family) [Nocardioides zeae]
MADQLHLNVNILNAGVFGGSWRFPGTDGLASYGIEHYTSIARRAEAAKLDAVFLADGPVLDPSIRHRTGNNLEPTTVLARIAAETERIGLIATLSSSYNDPVELARRLGDLDHVTGGRFGWNVVTTAGAAAAANFGRSGEPEHALRYRRAALVVEEVVGRWADRESLVSPQGRPVVVQAGGSSDGKRLAARVGEVIFSAEQDLATARAFRTELRTLAAELGRDPDEIVVLPGLSTVIGSTEEEARRRREVLDEVLPDAYARARLAGQLGVDLTELADDEPIPTEILHDPDTAGGSQTFYRVVRDIIDRENPTLRQLLRTLSGGGGHRIVVGTPEQVADDVERWFRHGAADGFNLMPDVLPSGLDGVVDGLVPELQRRGLFRRDYEGTTLRDHLGLGLPAVPGRLDPTSDLSTSTKASA